MARMTAQGDGPHGDDSASREIDAIVESVDDWRGTRLARLRAAIRSADPSIIEEIKWRKPTRPQGVPVWSRDGIICVADVLKSAVRLTFPKGPQMKDPKQLFNARLDSKAVRAIDVHENDTVDDAAIQALIREAVELNR